MLCDAMPLRRCSCYCYVLCINIVLLGLRLPTIKVDVLEKKSKDSETCNVVKQSLLFNETRRISCERRVKGSIVRITSTGSNAIGLSLCEVQVYGVPGKSIIAMYLLLLNISQDILVRGLYLSLSHSLSLSLCICLSLYPSIALSLIYTVLL